MTKFLDSEGLEHTWERIQQITNKTVYDALCSAYAANFGGYTTEEVPISGYSHVLVDSEDRVIAGIETDGSLYISKF